MRQIFLGIIAAWATSIPLCAHAATASLFGIELGKPLPMKECVKDHSPSRINTQPCYVLNDNRDPSLAMYSIPVEKRPHYLAGAYFGSILWLNDSGKVESITMDTYTRYHEDVLAALEKKFGKATRTDKPLGFLGSIATDENNAPIHSQYHWDLPGASLDYLPYSKGSEGKIRMETPVGTKIRSDFIPNPNKLAP